MITIDGSAGEGGGQIVRHACALALITGQPFHITNVRGGRKKPGLMRQHVTAIEAACAIGQADCDGVAVGSLEMTFRPGRMKAGTYRFAVGTAGSTGLVLQTVLLPLVLTDGPSRLVLEGGTHNMLAPPFEFIARSFLPIINRMGPRVAATLVRHGFYPSGGGRIEITVEPAPLRAVSCLARGELLDRSAMAYVAGLPGDIAHREIAAVREILDWPDAAYAIRELPQERGPGNILLLEAVYEHVTEIVSGFGQIGVTAERLASVAATRMRGYLESTAFAGPYLADQLLLPFALAAGSVFSTVKPTLHSLTAADVIQTFLGKRPTFSLEEDGTHHVRFV